MKNFEKHIDLIAEWVSDYMNCSDCPCYSECFKYTSSVDSAIGCGKFFKRWALEEADDGKKD